MKKSMMSRLLAYLLVMVMTVTGIPMQAFAAGDPATSDVGTSETASEGSSVIDEIADETTNYYEVEFGIPSKITPEEVDGITLPETQMVEAHTVIFALPEATWEEHEFLGWYYDPALEEKAAGEDEITKNITLYPSFTDLQHLDEEFRINYVSEEQVEPDYEIMISVHGLTLDQIRDLVAVRNLSSLKSDEEYVLDRMAPDLVSLIPEETVRAEVQTILTSFAGGELDGTLTEALQALVEEETESGAEAAEAVESEAAESENAQATEESTESSAEAVETTVAKRLLEDVVIYDLVSYYAEEELAATRAMQAQDLLMRVKEAGFDATAITVPELQEVVTAHTAESTESDAAEAMPEEAPEEAQNGASEEVNAAAESGTAEDTDLEVELSLEEEALADFTDQLLDAQAESATAAEYSVVEAASSDADAMTFNLKDFLAPYLEALPTARYLVRPVGGNWKRGDLHQVEISDTTYIRFFKDEEETGQYVIYYNITVHQDDFNNMKLNSEIVFLPYSEVEGVTLDAGLFTSEATTDGEITVDPNEDKGVMTYQGGEAIQAGTIVAVYDGTLSADQTVDGSVGYFRIREILGDGRYAYDSPDFDEVVFLPDIIPVRDDGSFDDGEILITADQLDFSGETYATLGLDANTVVEAGDFVAVYTGSLEDADHVALIGYGSITKVTENGDDLLVAYDAVSEATLKESSDMYMRIENVDVPVTEEELQAMGDRLAEEVEESGFPEQAADYIGELCVSDDAQLADSKYKDALKQVIFYREDGSEISLDEVRELTGGGRVELKWPPKFSFLMGLGLQHFTGTGLRAEGAIQVELTIKMNNFASLNIKAVALLEIEVALGLTIKWELDWRQALIFPYIYDVQGHVGLHAGVYIGAGITITMQTKATDFTDENATASGLIGEYDKTEGIGEKKKPIMDKIGQIGDGLGKLAKASKLGSDGLGISAIPGGETEKTISEKGNNQNYSGSGTQEMHNTVGGGLEEKYSNFVKDSGADYVPIIGKTGAPLFQTDLPVDPLHLIAFGLKIFFVFNVKIDVMLGTSITYGNAKEIEANFTIFHPSGESTCGDLETPNFRVDFFIFGMVGFHIGVMFDFRIGALSTTLCSLGITAEVGVFIEFYGFFYISYQWVSGEGTSSDMYGSMLAILGVYVDINFRAQMGDGKLQKDVDLYDIKWPLLSLGTEYFPLDFTIKENDPRLNLDITSGAKIGVTSDLFNIKFLGLMTGEIGPRNMDSTKCVDNGGESFRAIGGGYKQYDELYFHVTYKAKGKDFGTATEADVAKGRFLYDPRFNVIYAKPTRLEKEVELWGEFTFTWYQGGPVQKDSYLNYGAGFGLNSKTLSRTIKVHWKGVPVSGVAQIYVCNEPGKGLSEDYERAVEELKGNSYNYKQDYYDDLLERIGFKQIAENYTFKENVDFNGLDGILYYMDMADVADKYPGYRITFAKEDYDQEAIMAYANRVNDRESNWGREDKRAWIYSSYVSFTRETQQIDHASFYTYEKVKTYEDPDSQGWIMVDPNDPMIYFMMHKPKTEAQLYLDYYDAETDWHIIDAEVPKQASLTTVTYADGSKGVIEDLINKDVKLNHMSTVASVYQAKSPANELAVAKVPDTIQSEVDRTSNAYDFTWYMLTIPRASSPLNYRSPDGTVVDRSDAIGIAANQLVADGYPANGLFLSTYASKDIKAWRTDMPTLYEVFDEYKDRWVKMTDTTRIPVTPATFIIMREPKTFKVTWVYSDEDQVVTEVKYGKEPIPPKDAVLDGYEFQYWMDEDGNQVTEMPAHDIKLYPKYLGKEYTATWIYKGQTKTSQVREGQNVLEYCPMPKDNERAIEWYLDPDDAATRVPSTYQMPGHDLTLYGKYPILDFTITWMDGDEVVWTSSYTENTPVELLKRSKPGYEDARWRVSRRGGEVVTDGFLMPSENLTLLAEWRLKEYKVNWIYYDAETDTYSSAVTWTTPLVDSTVEGRLPYEIRRRIKDEDPYEYTYYSYAETDLNVVKADRSIWSKVKGSDQMPLNDGTIILVRDKRYVDVTWKYSEAEEDDPGTDITQTVWVGDKLKAPRDIQKEGYVLEYWADADGNTYEYPPTHNLELFPHLKVHVHSWEAPTYTWAADYSTCTAKRVCMEYPDHVETETVDAEQIIVWASDCTHAGKAHYRTKPFTNPEFVEQGTPIVDLPLDPNAHNWDSPRYSWTKENGNWICKAVRTCRNDYRGQHTLREKVTATKQVTVEPTCTTGGSCVYTATFANAVFESQTKTETLTSLGHDLVSHAAQAPTCTEKGWDAYTTCKRCDYTTYVEKKALGHSLTHHEAKAPTCTETGWEAYDECSRCDYTTYVELAATGHDYADPIYKWAEDNSSVTASRICRNDSTHEETETVDTVMTEGEATCTTGGSVVYTASFTNPIFTTQSKTTTVSALGHSWGTIKYEWSSDKTTCTASRTCKRDATHIETETVNSSNRETTPATCEADGVRTYTATFTNAAFKAQTTTESIAKIGHNYGDWVVTDPKPVETGSEAQPLMWAVGKKVKTCRNDSSHTVEEVVKVPTQLYSTGGEWVSISGTTATINLLDAAKDNDTTFERYYSNEDGDDMSTVGAVIDRWVYVIASAPGYEAWYDNYELNDLWMDPVEGSDADMFHFEYADAAQRDLVITDEANFGTSITVNVTLTPAEPDRFETMEATVVLNWPEAVVWGEPTYEWTMGTYTYCTATRHSTNYPGWDDIYASNEASAVTTDPTCTEAGSTTYTATFNRSEFVTQTKVVQGDEALGHDWKVSYGWATDNSSCTASGVCQRDELHTDPETAEASGEVTSAATCQKTGIRTLTATFTDPKFEAQTKDVEIPVDPSAHAATTTTTEPAPVYTEGEYWATDWTPGEAIVTCENCGAELSRTVIKKITPNLIGETTVHEVYIEELQNSPDGTLSEYDLRNLGMWPAVSISGAMFTKVNDEFEDDTSYFDLRGMVDMAWKDGTIRSGDIKLGDVLYVHLTPQSAYADKYAEADVALTVVAYPDEAEVIPPAEAAVMQEEAVEAGIQVTPAGQALGDGIYVAPAAPAAPTPAPTPEPTHPPCGHVNLEVRNQKGATCTEDGYSGDTYCVDCGQMLSSGSMIGRNGHAPCGAVVENQTPSTCTQEGGYDQVVYCANCGTELSRDHVNTGYTEHTPGAVTQENATAESYDNVVRCAECGVELSRETIIIPVTESEVPAAG